MWKNEKKIGILRGYVGGGRVYFLKFDISNVTFLIWRISVSMCSFWSKPWKMKRNDRFLPFTLRRASWINVKKSVNLTLICLGGDAEGGDYFLKTWNCLLHFFDLRRVGKCFWCEALHFMLKYISMISSKGKAPQFFL